MAAPFQLAAVLTLRQRREEAEEHALAQLEMERQQLSAHRERILDELRRWTQDGIEAGGSLGSAALQQQRHARIQLLLHLQEQVQQQLEINREARDRQRAVYLEARTARETLTELRSQQESIAAAAAQRREQRIMDDLFGAAGHRRAAAAHRNQPGKFCR